MKVALQLRVYINLSGDGDQKLGLRLFKSCPLMTFGLPKGMIRNDLYSYLILDDRF